MTRDEILAKLTTARDCLREVQKRNLGGQMTKQEILWRRVVIAFGEVESAIRLVEKK